MKNNFYFFLNTLENIEIKIHEILKANHPPPPSPVLSITNMQTLTPFIERFCCIGRLQCIKTYRCAQGQFLLPGVSSDMLLPLTARQYNSLLELCHVTKSLCYPLANNIYVFPPPPPTQPTTRFLTDPPPHLYVL
jgi:hypothetical protein